MKKAIISKLRGSLLCFIYEDSQLTDILPVEDDNIGNVYLGRVENVVPKINACFVDIGEDKPHYLNNLDEVNLVMGKKLVNGALVLVQLHKGPKRDKPGSVTSNIELSTPLVVVKLGKGGIGISKKITEIEDRQRLKRLGQACLRSGYSMVFRTAAVESSEEELKQNIEKVYKNFDDIFKKAGFSNKIEVIYKTPRQYLDRLALVDEVVTDSKSVYEQVLQSSLPITFYEDEIELATLYSLDSLIKKALSKRVYLKSGANIVIQDTEAMTVVDVNSAKAITGNKREKGIYQINLDSAKEILRQLRIRNISGIIMIDFVNMPKESQRVELVEYMQDLARFDYAKIVIYGFTRLGILEMSRKRVRTNLAEYIQEKEKNDNR